MTKERKFAIFLVVIGIMILIPVGIYILNVKATTKEKEKEKSTEVKVYFTQSRSGEDKIVPVLRKISIKNVNSKNLIEKLLEGPNFDERTKRIENAIPDGTKLLGKPEIEDNIIHLNFSKEIKDTWYGKEQTENIKKQIGRTLTQGSVCKIKVCVEGNPCEDFCYEKKE